MNWRDLVGRDDLPVPDFDWDPIVEHDAFYDRRRAGQSVDPSEVPSPARVRAVIEEVAAELLADYPEGTPVAELNSGACEDVAWRVVERLDGVDVMATPFFSDARCEDAHIWLRAGEWHFDAEAPGGVRSWSALPLYRRNAFLRQRRRTSR